MSTKFRRECLGSSASTRELNLLWSPDRYRTSAAREFARLARDCHRAGPD